VAIKIKKQTFVAKVAQTHALAEIIFKKKQIFLIT
jgi:hypothetical protein